MADTPLTKLQDEWRIYRDAVYPKGCPATQNRETHQAFFAGAFAALILAQKCAELPEDEATRAFGKLFDEAVSINQARAILAKHRN